MNRVSREAGFLVISGILLLSVGIRDLLFRMQISAPGPNHTEVTILAGLAFFAGSYLYVKLSKRDFIPMVLAVMMVMGFPFFMGSTLTLFTWVFVCIDLFLLAVFRSFRRRVN